MMNKLRFDGGNWSNRPRDAAPRGGLRRPRHRAAAELAGGQPRAAAGTTGWTPRSSTSPATSRRVLKDADYAKIKEFIDGGGIVFAHSDRGSIAFSKWVNELAGRVCPAYPLQDLPENHEVYSIVHRLNPKPKLRAASNGSRLLIVHCPMTWRGRGRPAPRRRGRNRSS